MRDFFISFLFIAVTCCANVWANDTRVCSEHNTSKEDCEGNATNSYYCKYIQNPNQDLNDTLCLVNCEPITQESVCKSYAGCIWDESECTYCPPNYYCDGNNNKILCNDSNNSYPDYSKSQDGADAEYMCYKPLNCETDIANTCGIGHPLSFMADMILCKTTISEIGHGAMFYSTDYHIESNNGCYLNNRPCNKFTAKTINYDFLDNNAVEGNAEWQDDDSGYLITSCRYTETGNDQTTLLCERKAFYAPNGQYLADSDASIVFNTNNYESYYCTGCINAKTYPSAERVNGCITPPENYNQACKCLNIPKGSYNPTGEIWTYNQELWRPQLCPVGKTTDNVGATNINQCRYGSATKICDGDTNHCVLLENLINQVAARNWHSVQ